MPPIAVVVPYFAIVRSAGLYDQPLALILVYTLFNLPLTEQAYVEFLQLQQDISQIDWMNTNDQWSYIWRNNKYTARRL